MEVNVSLKRSKMVSRPEGSQALQFYRGERLFMCCGDLPSVSLEVGVSGSLCFCNSSDVGMHVVRGSKVGDFEIMGTWGLWYTKV